MELPNIYKYKNYKLLIIIPILLIALSIYFIPKIPTGMDLRGGTLITLKTNSSFSDDALTSSLQKELGVSEVSISRIQTPLENKVEIELEQNERIAAGETDIRSFYSKVEKVNSLNYDISRFTSDLQSGNLSQADQADVQGRLADAQKSLPTATSDMHAAADLVVKDYEFFVGTINTSNATDTKTLESLLANASLTAKQKYSDKILAVLNTQMKVDQISIEDVSPSLSEFFVTNTEWTVLWSFLLTAALVLLIFRSLVPSIIVLIGALADITIAMGGMGLFQVPLTLPSIAALLMLIGFSLDTDILLVVRVMNRTEGTPRERAYGAMKTGVMMASVSILGFLTLFVLSLLTQISTYYEISSVIIFGLIADIFATWCTDAVIVLWYIERKAKGVHK
jgi:preprotein translocase subunit SecF